MTNLYQELTAKKKKATTMMSLKAKAIQGNLSESASVDSQHEAGGPETTPEGRSRFAKLYSWMGFKKGYNVPLCKDNMLLTRPSFSTDSS